MQQRNTYHNQDNSLYMMKVLRCRVLCKQESLTLINLPFSSSPSPLNMLSFFGIFLESRLLFFFFYCISLIPESGTHSLNE